MYLHNVFFSLVQSVNGAQGIKTTFLFPLFETAAFPAFGAVIVPLTHMRR